MVSLDLTGATIKQIIENSLQEDIGPGDITTLATVPDDFPANAYFYAKEDLVLAGLEVALSVFRLLAPEIKMECGHRDGARVARGTVIARISGPARAILAGERVALNLLQRMSGIASKTAGLVELVRGLPVKVVDTRKTMPGLRILDRYAVQVGGGVNHRFGLYDAVLIKDNHIKVAGSVKKAVEIAKNKVPHTMKIEVEVEDLVQVTQAIESGAEIIMFDNMPVDMMASAVRLVGKKALTEASGGITEQNIREVAGTGVDIISVGALTHSVKAMDISLKVIDLPKEGEEL